MSSFNPLLTSVAMAVLLALLLVFLDEERSRLGSVCILAAVLVSVTAAVAMLLLPLRAAAERDLFAAAVICNVTLIALVAAVALHDQFWVWRARGHRGDLDDDT